MKPIILTLLVAASTQHQVSPPPDSFTHPYKIDTVKSLTTKLQEVPQLEYAHPPSDDSSGNAYPEGQCTFWVKTKRPDLPNHLGNADHWFNELRAMGWPTGFMPRPGAVGQVIGSMHVVYVESLNPDGTIHIFEGNYDYNGSTREKDVDPTLYEYIY